MLICLSMKLSLTWPNNLMSNFVFPGPFETRLITTVSRRRPLADERDAPRLTKRTFGDANPRDRERETVRYRVECEFR